MAKAVGTDQGTTNSVIATVDGGRSVVPNAGGSRTSPSVEPFTDNGEELVGQSARQVVAERVRAAPATALRPWLLDVLTKTPAR